MGQKKAADESGPKVNVFGEIKVPLDAEYGLRPDFEAIEAIEREVRPIEQLLADANAGTLSIGEMAAITRHLMRGYGRAHPDDERILAYREANVKRLAELIYEAGAPRVRARLLVVLMGAVTGGYDASGEAKTPAIKTETRAGG